MSASSNAFIEEQQARQDPAYDQHMVEEERQYANKPKEMVLSPDTILVLSKSNVRDFHNTVKTRIKETGYGLLEYLEVLKFFEKLKEVISGNSQAKDLEEREGDREVRDMVRAEITKYNGKFTSSRGVKFENAEVGTKYNFLQCGDPILMRLEAEAKAAAERLKERQEFLKKVPVAGMEIRNEDELVTIYPPSKSSTSSYKISLPK